MQDNYAQIKPNKFRFLDIVKMAIIFLVSEILTTIIIFDTEDSIFVEVISIILMLGFLAIVLKPFIIEEMLNENSKKITIKKVGIIVGMVIACLIINAIINALLHIDSTANEDIINELIKAHPISVAIQIAIFAPIVEELIFRYYFLKDGKWWTFRVILSTLLFAIMHVAMAGSPVQILIESCAYIPPTILLIYLRLLFKSAKFSMIGHITYNTIGLITLIIALFAT